VPRLKRRAPPTIDTPGPKPRRVDERLRHLELDVLRRLDGMLQGDYRGLITGIGSEPGESRPYYPGDDLRRMDWRLTARTAVPHVRDTIADRELELWVVVDDSPSQRFGTGHVNKWDLSLNAVAAVALLTARAGNRVGGLLFGGGPLVPYPAQTGLDAALHLVARLDAASQRTSEPADRSTLEDALYAVSRLARHRGMVVVVSDFLFDDSWAQGLRALRGQHDVIVFEIVDPRELELPSVGMLTLVDAETGRTHHVYSSSPGVRERYAELTAAQRSRIRDSIRFAGAAHVVLRTDTDWVIDIARFVERRRRLARTGARHWSEVLP
jgi:uncharacterized protein (DUF58 family)